MKYYIEATEKQIAAAREWKSLADKYSLTIQELRELAYHIKEIERLLGKDLKDKNVIRWK